MDRAEITKRLAYYRELRDSTLSALKSLTESGEVESYGLTDADGGQNVRRRKIAELQQALLDYEKQIDNLTGNLQGGGIRTFGTNRYA